MSTASTSLCPDEESVLIRTQPCPNCYLCEEPGESLYEQLRDRLYGAPGSWNLRRCSNAKCGMVWLDPMPVEEDISRAYRTYYTHDTEAPQEETSARRVQSRIRSAYISAKYGYREKSRDLWAPLLAMAAYLDPIRRANYDFSVFYQEYKVGGRLLELGCGNGARLKSMQELGWQVEGVDFDPEAVSQAKRRGIPVHLGTLAEQKFPDASFDAIVGIHFVEHILDPLGMLQECRRLLKPGGGQLVMLTPNAASWGHATYKTDWRGLEPPRHLHIFTPSSIRELCNRVGFKASFCGSTIRGSGMHLASRMLRRGGKPH